MRWVVDSEYPFMPLTYLEKYFKLVPVFISSIYRASSCPRDIEHCLYGHGMHKDSYLWFPVSGDICIVVVYLLYNSTNVSEMIDTK